MTTEKEAEAKGQSLTKWKEKYQVVSVGTGEKIHLTPGMINRLINPNASLEECIIFAKMCVSYGANPFLKDMHLIKYSKEQRDPAAHVAGIGFFEKKAQKNPIFEGYGQTLFMNEKGEWLKCFVPKNFEFLQYPMACEVSCYVKGYKEIQKQIVTWSECFGRKRDGSINATWNKQPGTMLEKVAKVRLLRKLFSAELGGLYTTEEMHIDNAIDVEFEVKEEATLKPGSGKISESNKEPQDTPADDDKPPVESEAPAPDEDPNNKPPEYNP